MLEQPENNPIDKTARNNSENNFETKQKLSGAWDAIYQITTKQPRIKAVIESLLQQPPKTKFAEKFLEKYKAINPND